MIIKPLQTKKNQSICLNPKLKVISGKNKANYRYVFHMNSLIIKEMR